MEDHKEDSESVQRMKKRKQHEDAEKHFVEEQRVVSIRRVEPKDSDKFNENREMDFFTAMSFQIEKARKGRWQKLDLSGGVADESKFSNLSFSFHKLDSVRTLNLSNNSFTEIPEELRQLPKLESLDLSNNRLQSLSEVLSSFPNLRTINLAGNGLTGSTDVVADLANLEQLNLSGNGLTTFPEAIRKLEKLTNLNLSRNILTKLPEFIGKLTSLKFLELSLNALDSLPDTIGKLKDLQLLDVSYNSLTALPKSIEKLLELRHLDLHTNKLISLPENVGKLSKLKKLNISDNELSDLPASLAQLDCFDQILYINNPLNLELDAAYKEGRNAVRRYLGSKAGEQITLNEAKLIIVGEGEVGKSCLLDALLGNPWQEHDTTHGIEIKQIRVTHNGRETTLNAWDFGGQRIYRPTHQLFFSAPAVYLVIWKPREGPQQGFVKEWIQLIKRREPDARILVVATHGGPGQRQPDIDRQELWDLFGKETVVDFFSVESKPDINGERRGIDNLKQTIARVASDLPEIGRLVPKRWQSVREALMETGAAYLPLDRILEICHSYQMDDEEARLFVTIEHRLGHLIHYQHDPTLRDIVVLKPNWLATAISFILDDEKTRSAHGLVRFSRLIRLWNDPDRPVDSRYPEQLHPIFLRLMERFDLSYRVADPSSKGGSDTQSLIAQLVPDTRPEKDLENEWARGLLDSDIQQVQICRIVDAQKGQSAPAEGLFYQLIVRLHKYSLGRVNYNNSVHWQRGLVLDDDYNGRALLEHLGNDVRITVRAPYPERFLAMLTGEVKYLVESFWEGLRCDVMVPCVDPCGRTSPGTGLFDVQKLIESKRKGRPEYPCPVCNQWQDIDHLLRNAPAAQPDANALIFAEFTEVKAELAKARHQLSYQGEKIMGRFDRLDDRTRRTLSRVDKTYTDFLEILTDEAKDGPRLFSLTPVNRSNFNPKEWIKAKFRLTLWCEHSRLPLSVLNEKDSDKGIYEIEITREWFKMVAPYLRWLTRTLSLVLPVASSAVQLTLDKTAYEEIEKQLDFSKSIIDATMDNGTINQESIDISEADTLEYGTPMRAKGAILRELHALLKSKDPGFGGLVRVMNKHQEFLWVHERFSKEY